MSKVAFTLWFWVMVTLQEPAVPVHTPPQPSKTEPWSAVSVSVTVLPAGKVALQAEPQLIPGGLLVIVPVPLPDLLIVTNAPVKLAVTCLSAFISRMQEPTPLHAPPHPTKSFPGSGMAVSVTEVPLL